VNAVMTFVERGECDARRPGEIERNRRALRRETCTRLLGDVDGVVAELLEVQRDAKTPRS
jgi:hypothetical protein